MMMRMKSLFQIPHRALGLSAVIVLTLWLSPAMADAMTFRTSSIGYHPKGPKVAIIEDVPDEQELKLVLFDPAKRNPRPPFLVGTTVYKIENAKAFYNKGQQGPRVKNVQVDFSDFTTPGQYEIRVEGTDIKAPVKISEFLYWDTLKPVVKSFYYQRCGQDIESSEPKVYHAACHQNDANFINSRPSVLKLGDEADKDVVGGWHNGGDYAKYVTSVALSAAKLMSMYEWNNRPFRYFKLDYLFSEPNLGDVPDLQHEIRYGLDWLMTMQRTDGAFYRKVSGKQWPGIVSPEDDSQPRFLYGISTQETANAAATLAMVQRNYKKDDLGYGVKALLMAERAWGFLESHPTAIFESSDSDFAGSGEFITYTPDRKLIDLPSRIWAASELYITTGKPKYHQYFLQNYAKIPFDEFSWKNPAFQGYADYLLYAPNKDEKAASYLKRMLADQAEMIRKSVESDDYQTGLRQYGRGSNQDLTEQAAMLLTAYRVTGQEKYRDAAGKAVSYLFGVNPLGKTFVTGIGENAVQTPSHRWMQVLGKTLPGYLVNGPDENAPEGKTPKNAGALSYTDQASVASVNESTLLNNASLAYVLGILNATFNASEACPPDAPAGSCSQP
jgi:endoglucanase